MSEDGWTWQVEFTWGFREEPDHLGACWRARFGPGTTGYYRAVDESGEVVWESRHPKPEPAP